MGSERQSTAYFEYGADISRRKQAEDALKITNEELKNRVVEVEEHKEELRQQALHDPLTGLYNRRYLSETLPCEIMRTGRANDCA